MLLARENVLRFLARVLKIKIDGYVRMMIKIPTLLKSVVFFLDYLEYSENVAIITLVRGTCIWNTRITTQRIQG